MKRSALGSWALLMAACVSTPIRPLDGALLSHTRVGVALNLLLFGIGLALLLGY